MTKRRYETAQKGYGGTLVWATSPRMTSFNNGRIAFYSGGIEMNAKLIVGIILAGMAVLFIFQNAMPVELTFLFWTLSMSRALLMFLILSVGVILGWLLHGSFRRIKTAPMHDKAL